MNRDDKYWLKLVLHSLFFTEKLKKIKRGRHLCFGLIYLYSSSPVIRLSVSGYRSHVLIMLFAFLSFLVFTVQADQFKILVLNSCIFQM